MILNKQIGVYLNHVHFLFKQYISRKFTSKGFDLTPEQFLVMDTLWDEGVLSQQQISQYIQKDKNSVTKLIDGLEKRGLVLRAPAGDDRRINNIVLTENAKDIQQEVVALALKSVDQICEGIPTDDMQTFISVLKRMAKNMNQLSPAT
jgi:Transcriptional regulators